MAVTLMLFVRLPKARTSARVKQDLKEMENTARVRCFLHNQKSLLTHLDQRFWIPQSAISQTAVVSALNICDISRNENLKFCCHIYVHTLIYTVQHFLAIAPKCCVKIETF